METVRDQLVQTKLTERMTELREQYPVRFDFTQIRIFDMVSYAVEHASDNTATEATETTIEESDPTEAVSEETRNDRGAEGLTDRKKPAIPPVPPGRVGFFIVKFALQAREIC